MVQHEAYFLSTLDPFRRFLHQITQEAQSCEVSRKQQASAAQTLCRLANGLPPVFLENQMVERLHEQDSVVCHGWHCIQVSSVSPDKPRLSIQSLIRKPELTSFQQARGQINRRDGIASSAQSERIPSRRSPDLKDGACGREITSEVAPCEIVLKLMSFQTRVLILNSTVVKSCHITDVVSHTSVSFERDK
jgi:hypothetical protein